MFRFFQKGFNYGQDGRGNRLVYHLCGCNFHCPWCSNPEGLSEKSGAPLDPDDVISEAISCVPMFFDGGGVTFTGGECTLYFDELKYVLTRLRDENINTAIETNGSSKRLSELFPVISELIIDFKHYDSKKHRDYTLADNLQTMENIKNACALHRDMLIRIPLIKGFNASTEDIEKIGEILVSYKAENARVELLRYHEYGKNKWEKLGMKYTMHDAFVSAQEKALFEKILKQKGLNIVNT